MFSSCFKFGSMPFWFWNGDQDETEITRQMELARQGGVRGLAIHARKGNRTEYMSERWLALVRHACVEARRLNLEIWLYDEEGCPSGTVGERLPSRGQQYQQQALTFAYMTAGTACTDDNFIRGFRSEELIYSPKGGGFKGELIRAFRADDLNTPVDPADLPGDTELLVFSRLFITDYIDALARDTLEAFLEMTHRVYRDKLGEFFGDPVTAIYTDDLNHLLVYGDDIPYLSYTDSLEDTFRSKCGYSILDKLPFLVENLPGCERVRLDYRHTVMRMFLDNYVEPMRQWCEEQRLPLTGHLSGDEGSMKTSISRFSAAMPFYEHEDIPGIDDFLTGMEDSGYLRRPFNELGFSAIILCKQVSSAANQLKNGKCSSEVLTSLGWGVPLSRQMAQIRFQQGLGINMIVPHDFSYSTAGLTKRDHPASYFFQQPWYRENRELHDALARTSGLLSRGRCAARLAVLNPVTSGWVALDGRQLSPGFTCRHPGILPGTDKFERDLAEISLHLLRRHLDFEYIDEELLARHGGVRDGLLTLGAAAYDTLVSPPLCNIQRTTLALLKDFAAAGGKIIRLGASATLVDGIPSDEAAALPAAAFTDLNALDCGINSALEFAAVAGGATEEVLLHTRQVNGKMEYFMVNLSEKAQTLSITSDLSGYILYDPQTDRIITDHSRFPGWLVLHPLACCHILPEAVTEAATENILETLFAPEADLQQLSWEMQPEISVEPENENVLLLDAGLLKNGAGILFSDSVTLPEGTKITIPVNISVPERVTGIYAENPEKLKMTINGKSPEWTLEHHPATQDLRLAPLRGLLRPGNNEIQFITNGQRIEMFYLAGRFAVQLNENGNICNTFITEQPLTLRLGDASRQGLPFYWGTLDYSLEFTLDNLQAGRHYWLDPGEVSGIIRVMVNGKDAGLRYGKPWRFSLNGMLFPGKNRIEMKLSNTAQNFFGPHRAKNIFGPHRAREGSSVAAWTPETESKSPDAWGIAGFGIYGPVKLFDN